MIAVLYDIHGNLPALEAVLADASAHGAGHLVLGGDYALFGAWPEETVDRLSHLDATWVRGNGERWMARPEEAPEDEVVQGAVAAVREALGGAVDGFITLPESVAVDDTRFWHASPLSDVRSFLPEPAADEEELLHGVTERRIVFGHTHLQFRRVAAGPAGEVELINPGSVGMPLDGDPRAAYALIAPDGTLELRRVAYDHAGSAAALRRRYGDAGWALEIARRVESARI